eukprot:1584201-Rhodomonas_salina.4
MPGTDTAYAAIPSLCTGNEWRASTDCSTPPSKLRYLPTRALCDARSVDYAPVRIGIGMQVLK